MKLTRRQFLAVQVLAVQQMVCPGIPSCNAPEPEPVEGVQYPVAFPVTFGKDDVIDKIQRVFLPIVKR